MNSKARKTIARVFANPAPANLKWSDIESMLKATGADVVERSGSRVLVEINGVSAVLHRPHPNPTATRPQVRSVKQLLQNAGIHP